MRLTARRSWLLVAAVLIVVAVAGTWALQTPSTSPAARTPMPAGVAGDWTLKFDDEFNGTSLDTTKWSTGWGGGTGITAPVNSTEDDCYDPAQVAEGGGALSLTLTRESESCGTSAQYAAGLINTDGKFNFTYGFIQARVWLPGTPGNPDYVANWPGVWTDGQNWPDDGEIDIAEGINGNVCAFFHDAATVYQALSPGGGNGCPNGVYTEGWHTFAANWEPGIITWYYDGVDIGSVTSGVTSAPMFLILDYDAQSPAHAPDTMKVDYIRVWQHPYSQRATTSPLKVFSALMGPSATTAPAVHGLRSSVPRVYVS